MPDAVVFVETLVFAARRVRRLSDEEFRQLQSMLLENPKSGAVMPGCAGLRKVRLAQRFRGKGTRGGVRVIYLNLPKARRLDLITIYSKDEKATLTNKDKRELRALVMQLHKEVDAKLKQEEPQ
jgi:hypothetical protein